MLRSACIFEETEDETMCRFRSMTFPQFFKDFGKSVTNKIPVEIYYWLTPVSEVGNAI